MFIAQQIPYQQLSLADGFSATIKRIDLVHPTISGNKFFKLKYNLLKAKQLGKSCLLSFGGAYSNHLFALAHAAQHYGFQSIGMVRGEELQHRPLNPTLRTAQSLGMQLNFVSRSYYRLRQDDDYLRQLAQDYPDSYIIPEGGSNALAVQGCGEILSDQDRQDFDIICCAVGTGGTLAGLINASAEQQQVWGFAALKGDFLTAQVRKWSNKHNWQIFSEDCFGGYGRFDARLLEYIRAFQQQQHVPLEPIYTGKMLYRLEQMIKNNQLSPASRVLLIHTGGLQIMAG